MEKRNLLKQQISLRLAVKLGLTGKIAVAATGTAPAANLQFNANGDLDALALGAGGNLVAQQLCTSLGLDEAGVTDSRNLGGATFTVGNYVSPRLFLSYGVSLIGTGQVVTLKYLLRRGFDISVESGHESAASLNWRTER